MLRALLVGVVLVGMTSIATADPGAAPASRCDANPICVDTRPDIEAIQRWAVTKKDTGDEYSIDEAGYTLADGIRDAEWRRKTGERLQPPGHELGKGLAKAF